MLYLKLQYLSDVVYTGNIISKLTTVVAVLKVCVLVK